jgi:hypothetical protein
MPVLTLTLKLPFYRLNQIKALESDRLTAVNTQVANELLTVDQKERKKLTSAAFRHIEIGSASINQTICNTNARTKVKHFQRMWLETNNQNFEISKQGDFYTVAFNLLRGRKGRIPLEVHAAKPAARSAPHTDVLDKVRDGSAQLGSLKLCQSKKGIWYALISVSMDVPDAGEVKGWIGVDRGQNNIAVAALPKGFGQFWGGASSQSPETTLPEDSHRIARGEKAEKGEAA